jgi:hypothetical protein
MLAENKRMFVANRAMDEVARGRLLGNLEEALARLNRVEERSGTVRWAVELEPGPLFIVRDWRTLRGLCIDLDRRAALGCVGVNLDIAHWRLASRQSGETANEITVEKVREEGCVLRRVLHGHIAGHHPAGHFGDVPLDSLNEPNEDFTPWIGILNERSRASGGGGHPPYSGYLSVEIEATKRFDYAARSVRSLVALLTR